MREKQTGINMIFLSPLAVGNNMAMCAETETETKDVGVARV